MDTAEYEKVCGELEQATNLLRFIEKCNRPLMVELQEQIEVASRARGAIIDRLQEIVRR